MKHRKKISPPDDPAIIAIRSKRGMQTKIAVATGLSKQAVSLWRRVTAEHVMTVAPMIGMTPQQVRPDVFGRPKGTPNGKKIRTGRRLE